VTAVTAGVTAAQQPGNEHHRTMSTAGENSGGGSRVGQLQRSGAEDRCSQDERPEGQGRGSLATPAVRRVRSRAGVDGGRFPRRPRLGPPARPPVATPPERPCNTGPPPTRRPLPGTVQIRRAMTLE